MKKALIKVKSLEHLRKLAIAKHKLGMYLECFISMGILRSSKQIDYFADDKRPWFVFNSIDGSDETLTDEDMEEYSNIGEAIKKGCFYAEK